LVVDGERIGTVVVLRLRAAAVPGHVAGFGMRTVVARIRYRARTPIQYAAQDWVVVDSVGRRHPSLGAQAPRPALGSGRVSAGRAVTANVAFDVPFDRTVLELVLTDGAGRDLVSMTRSAAG
jgi:hypothetical protein